MLCLALFPRDAVRIRHELTGAELWVTTADVPPEGYSVDLRDPRTGAVVGELWGLDRKGSRRYARRAGLTLPAEWQVSRLQYLCRDVVAECGREALR
jgi:hypothetical protein